MPRQRSLEKVKSCCSDFFPIVSSSKGLRRSPSSISSIKRSRISRKDQLPFSQRRKENIIQEPGKSYKLARRSRRIRKHKCLQREILREITNLGSVSSSRESVISETFKEDEPLMLESSGEKTMQEETATKNKDLISYVSSLTGKTYQFFIYDEKLLNIPKEYQTKTIEQACDNDCSSEEDLIERSIKKLKTSLIDAVKSTLSLDLTIEKTQSRDN